MKASSEDNLHSFGRNIKISTPKTRKFAQIFKYRSLKLLLVYVVGYKMAVWEGKPTFATHEMKYTFLH